MTRYERVKQIIESLPDEDKRICVVDEGRCGCRGCVTSHGITKREFAWWLQNHSGIKPLPISLLDTSKLDMSNQIGTGVYLFNEAGYPIGIKK